MGRDVVGGPPARGRLGPRLLVLLAAVAALYALAAPARAGGSFQSSDDLVNLIWSSSVRTATDMISPAVDLDPRGCQISLPAVILDGYARDRCPYVGDLAVTGMTLLVSQDDVSVLRAMIGWFGDHQRADGSIPASPFRMGTFDLFDYNAYWVETLYDYTLYTGDLSLLRAQWSHVVHLMDGFYLGHVGPSGLLVAWAGAADYGYIPRAGTTVAYYNAQYVLALRQASALATWAGDAGRAQRWLGRASVTAAAFGSAFWDPVAGAFRDTTASSTVHPLDGNAFALLAGLATQQQISSVLTYIERNMRRSYGNQIADVDGWNGPGWGAGDSRRVYPFIGYFELLARYGVGAGDSALELIRREWGFMATRDPGTMWETIGSRNGGPSAVIASYDHGWSSGAAPALASFVLGVQPTSPGFATFTVNPNPGDLDWANGSVPTPHGPIRVSWHVDGGRLSLSVTPPPGTVWANDPSRAAVTAAAAPAARVERAPAVRPAVPRAALMRLTAGLRTLLG